MQLFEEQHDPTHIAAVADAAGSYGAPIRDDAEEDELPGLGENFVVDVLAAVAGMALRSKRRQADLDAALRCAGVECGVPAGWRCWSGCARAAMSTRSWS